MLNVVPGYGKGMGAHLVAHPDVHAIAFGQSNADGNTDHHDLAADQVWLAEPVDHPARQGLRGIRLTRAGLQYGELVARSLLAGKRKA